jgi:hypothetical protein
MNFTQFLAPELILPMAWLGKRDWIEYGDIPERRSVWARPKELVLPTDRPKPPSVTLSEDPWLKPPGKIIVNESEYKNRPKEFWQGVKIIIDSLRMNVVSCYWQLGLSKALAEGPKVFVASEEQCEDLEAMNVSFPFSEYHVPYYVFIIKLPDGYRRKLAQMHGLPNGPEYVFMHLEEGNIIVVTSFFSRNNVITNLIPNRPEYQTIEDAIMRNRDRRVDKPIEGRLDPSVHREEDFEVSELVSKMAINLGMYMTLVGTHIRPLDPQGLHRQKQFARSGNKAKADKARIAIATAPSVIQFNQVVKFHDEEVEAAPADPGDPDAPARKSPKPHRRKGHWRWQRHGPKNSLTKWIPIKPVLVRAWAFTGDPKDSTTTYIPVPRK